MKRRERELHGINGRCAACGHLRTQDGVCWYCGSPTRAIPPCQSEGDACWLDKPCRAIKKYLSSPEGERDPEELVDHCITLFARWEGWRPTCS